VSENCFPFNSKQFERTGYNNWLNKESRQLKII